ncbi:MAG: thiamine ABC transporter substrate-binding protein [Patescibacteria group bacterium]
MKKIYILLTVFLFGTGCVKSTPVATEPTTLTVYTYDSLSADYGLLPAIKDQFEQDHQITLNIVSFTDTGAMLNQLIAEKNNPKADVVLGLDNINLPDLKTNNLLDPYKPTRASAIPKRLRFDNDFTMTPFDYGYVSFVYDSQALTFSEPISLMELVNNSAYNKKIIIEQPGLSSPGTQLLFWAHQALGDDQAKEFFDKLSNQVLTVAPDWNTAYYSMFLNDQAPIVLSYVTSPAYHIDQEQTDRYKTIPITDGYLPQVEGVGLVHGSAATTLGQQFIDYMLSQPVQQAIPTTQWMFPVLKNEVTLPDAYSQIITPNLKTSLPLDEITIQNNYTPYLEQWHTSFGL